MKRTALPLLLIGCASGPHARGQGALVPDASGVAATVTGPVTSTGLWFPDEACAKQFPPGPIAASAAPAFAKCLDGLALQPGTRKHRLPDTAVFTYGPGIEVEARFAASATGPHMISIGFVGGSEVPTIAPATLEMSRTAGSSEPTFDDAARAVLDRDGDAYAWLKVCVDAAGAVSDAQVIEASTPPTGEAFATAVHDWKFTPFVLGRTPSPVCTVRRLEYPSPETLEAQTLPMTTAALDAPMVPSLALGKRIDGQSEIVPDEQTRIELAKAGNPAIAGGADYCIDATGKVTTVKIVAPTGIAAYDQQLEAGIARWQYKPFMIEDKPAPVCSAVIFRYSQAAAAPGP